MVCNGPAAVLGGDRGCAAGGTRRRQGLCSGGTQQRQGLRRHLVERRASAAALVGDGLHRRRQGLNRRHTVAAWQVSGWRTERRVERRGGFAHGVRRGVGG
ncbi:hypothetical protein PIB30_054829, partial [Stylosanthes scabra]|nr:hypothetical protein [Stylosanthes scabra]